MSSGHLNMNQLNKDSKGYYFCKTKNKYRARIVLDGKFKHLGYFNTEKEASDFYKNFKNNLI
jgi:hypothetical protein